MSFSQSTITAVDPPELVGAQWYVSWSTTSPTGTWWQIYVDQNLAWVGQRTSVLLPVPPGVQRLDIGAVTAGDEYTSYASSLPTAPARRATLTWTGGTYLAADLASYRIYSSDVPGGSIDYTAPVATITAYPGGIYTDGFGWGTFGGGGFGLASQSYTWVSGPLAAGVWSFAIVPVDSAGNAGTASTTTVTIDAPPAAPGPNSNGTRLSYTYATDEVTLNWNASP